jgi:hypothetical protein
MSPETFAEEYVRLALSIDQHLPGYIDAYLGPAEWKAHAKSQGAQPLSELAGRVAALANAIGNARGVPSERKEFLARHVTAMRISVRLLRGEKLPLADEVLALYDVLPAWTDEAHFEEAQRQLDELLPRGPTLLERMTARNKALEISVEQAGDLLPRIQERLRALTRERFPLPEQEAVDFVFVKDKPWGAYNWFLGGGRSRVELNTDLPLRINALVNLVAHEAYPGHHTELSIKHSRLFQQAGRLEHAALLINSPSCVVSEGIATAALSIILPEEDLLNWYSGELFPRASLQGLDARREHMIDRALLTLYAARGNAAFMLHDRGVGADELTRYLQCYELRTEQEARKTIEFLGNPLYRSYVFTYTLGRDMLTALFAKGRDVTHWYTRLLTEAVIPAQIRRWEA